MDAGGWKPGRRAVLAGAAALWPAFAFGQTTRRPADPSGPPVVFVHGNGDSAALWINNIWRFETNGFKRGLLFAIDLPWPLARSDDSKEQQYRSSTADQMKELASYVAQVRKTTRQGKVALIASSRGGNTVRNYLKNGGGAAHVSHAILCGTPNKGIVISDSMLVGSEFNGAAPFLKGLNGGPDDLIPGVQMMAIRSDKNDKYSQPDARFVGNPGKPTGVSYDASELRGAKNVILDGLDHRETAFHKLAFAAQYEFITGKAPATLFIAQEPLPVLNGKVTGIAPDNSYTNLPVAGAVVEVYDVDPHSGERKGAQPVHRKTTGADGLWGPFIGHSDAAYEFVLTLQGQPTTHTYRSPFLRGSDVVDLRPMPFGKGDDQAGAVVI
ncbi:MAG: alpha/beta fold hydrolase, partial [Proteobacteria bacterium]|nr:alpha/beta fold hydrolase [Pseudomonadota bacterium]